MPVFRPFFLKGLPLLVIASCMLCSVHFVQYTVVTIHRSLAMCRVYYSLSLLQYFRVFAANCALCTVRCSCRTANCEICTVLCEICTVLSVLGTVHCLMCTVHFALCTVSCTIFLAKYLYCALWTPKLILSALSCSKSPYVGWYNPFTKKSLLCDCDSHEIKKKGVSRDSSDIGDTSYSTDTSDSSDCSDCCEISDKYNCFFMSGSIFSYPGDLLNSILYPKKYLSPIFMT